MRHPSSEQVDVMLDILLNVDDMRDDTSVIRLGMAIAGRFSGFVTGLHVVDAYPQAIVIPEAMAALASEEDEARQREPWWNALCQRHGVAGAWEVIRGIRVPILARRSSMADVTIDTLPSSGQSLMLGADYVTSALFAGASPMLLVPSNWQGSMRQARILVAWNSSIESMRAVRAALPFLREAERICVVDGACDDLPGLSPPPLPLIDWLARQGVATPAVRRASAADPPGELLLREARAMDADLLVMGAWGHSRIGEWMLGGATRHVLGKAWLPVLLAH